MRLAIPFHAEVYSAFLKHAMKSIKKNFQEIKPTTCATNFRRFFLYERPLRVSRLAAPEACHFEAHCEEHNVKISFHV
jgi:hypothetical protein